MADTPVLVLPGIVGTVNAAGGSALKTVFCNIGLAVSSRVTYGTISAGSIGFAPKMALVNYNSAQTARLIDIAGKAAYGYSGSSIDVVFPDGSARAMGNSGWPAYGSAATPSYATYGGMEYAAIRYTASNGRYYARTIWFHADGSVRVYSESQYSDSLAWESFQCLLIG